MSYTKSKDLIDPQSFGNWILVDERNPSAETVDFTISNLNGDQDKYYKIIYNGIFSNSSVIGFTLNGDNGSNYFRHTHYLNDVTPTHGASYNGGGTYAVIGVVGGTGGSITGETLIYAEKNGASRKYFANYYEHRTGGTLYKNDITGMWSYTTNVVNSIRVFISGAVTFTGRIQVYKWTDIKPVTLHSYELVKEYNLTNQTIDDVITWDGDVDDTVIVESRLSQTGSGTVVQLQLNSSSTGYTIYGLYQDGATAGGYSPGNTGFPLASPSAVSVTSDNFSFLTVQLKNGLRRFASYRAAYYSPNNADSNCYQYSGYWNDLSTKITSLRINGGGVNWTGTIKVYKLAKSHLICQEPGLLRGMWQKSVDNNTVQVQPGSIEIGGVTHNQGSAINVTLSGNLRSGESEAANTYFYLYAIKSDSRTPTYKFSSISPSKDRFGNTLSLVDAEFDQDLYHPNDNTWRYIGQVYNDASSNILAFSKCKPGYWEGAWTSIPGTGQRTLKHGSGKLPRNVDMLCKFNTSYAGSYPQNYFYINGDTDYSHQYGIKYSFVTTIDYNCVLGYNGFYFESGWKTTGYYKLIVR